MPTSALGKQRRVKPRAAVGGRLALGDDRHFGRARLAHGFTLIEIVVVILILSIMLGLAGMRLTRDDGDTLREEARRLALVLQNANQQAILEGRPFAFKLSEDGYRFLQLNADSRLVPIERDELLAPRVLPKPMTVAPVETAKTTDGRKREDILLFYPSGEFAPFAVVLAIGNSKWYVQGLSNGQITATSTLASASA